jgi:3-carboxy-cis,cis-muconate cycloisomerase
MSSLLRDRPAGSAAMLAIFADEAVLRGALDFEAALAAAQAAEGLIGEADATAIGAVCGSLSPDIPRPPLPCIAAPPARTSPTRR